MIRGMWARAHTTTAVAASSRGKQRDCSKSSDFGRDERSVSCFIQTKRMDCAAAMLIATHTAPRLAKHVLAIESDSGVYRPEGFGLAATAPLQPRSNLQEIAKLLSGIGADRIAATGGGADIGPIMREGVVGASLDVDGSRYFDIHHTHADTLDKIDPQELALCVATMAVMAYTVADMQSEHSSCARSKRQQILLLLMWLNPVGKWRHL